MLIAEERTLVLKFRKAKEKKDALEKQLKAAKEEFDQIEFQLLELLEAQLAKASAKYEGIGYVRENKPKLYASCNVGDQPELMAYLKKEKREDLIITAVPHGKLSTYLKECIEDGTMKKLPEIVSYYFKSSLKLYK